MQSYAFTIIDVNNKKLCGGVTHADSMEGAARSAMAMMRKNLKCIRDISEHGYDRSRWEYIMAGRSVSAYGVRRKFLRKGSSCSTYFKRNSV